MLQRLGIRDKENSVDEWIQNIANDKTEINAQAESLLKSAQAESFLKTSAVDFIRQQLRAPIVVTRGASPGTTAIHVEHGERSLYNDLKQYNDDSDFRRNALIAAIGVASVAAGTYAVLKNPKLKAMALAQAKKTPLIDDILGSVGPTAMALGGLGLLNQDANVKKDLALLAGGALATYKASKGDTSKVPWAVKAVGLGVPFAGAGLTYAGSRAEELEGRKNLVTQVFPSGRYMAPHSVLNLAEGHDIQSIKEHYKERFKK
jgi:hypothetical protein